MRQLTPHGTSGVAVFSFSSDERRSLRSCLRDATGAPFGHEPCHSPVRARLVADGVPIDDVLLVDRRGAGDELHTHGSPVISDWIRSRFRADCEAAGPTAAMALARQSVCVEQLALAEEQAGWDFRAELNRLERLEVGKRRDGLVALIHRSYRAFAQTRPLRIVLVGRQNVGKSTLFNKLVGRNRAVAGPCSGLTRDGVRELVVLDGYVYELCDAAGEGERSRDVDEAAIDMARARRRGAEWLVVLDASREIDEQERAWVGQAALVVSNKVDRGACSSTASVSALHVSALNDDGAVLRSAIGAELRRGRGLECAGPVGGVAALDAEQVRRLVEFATQHGLDGDCDDLLGPA